MKERKKISFIHSISAKISILTMCVVIVSVAICVFSASYGSKSMLTDVYGGYILNMAETTCDVINKLPEDSRNFETFSDLLSSIKMSGIESSYAYLVDSTGMMLYHPTEEKIGQKVENK